MSCWQEFKDQEVTPMRNYYKQNPIDLLVYVPYILALILVWCKPGPAQDAKTLTPEQQAIYNILMPHQEMSPEARALFDPNYVPPVKKDNAVVRGYKSYDYSLKLDYAQRYCAINKPTAKHPKVQRVYIKNGDIYECATKTITKAGTE
jgi:hypothetical protein